MNLPVLAKVGNSRYLPVALCVTGLLERLALLASAHIAYGNGEAENVALSFARNGTIGDVFARGSGLTAHLNPILPTVAGAIYSVFGVQSAVSEWILAIISTSIVMAAAGIFYLSAGSAGIARSPRLAALAVFALLPVFRELETTTFRVWEGGLATLLGAVVLLLVTRAERDHALRARTMVAIALAAALLFFLNPAYGLAAYAATGLLMIRSVPLRKWLGHSAILAGALCVVLAPWTIRNYQTFHQLIPLRGNFGLELAVANHPAALGGPDRQVFVDRLRTIHPLESQAAFDRMQASGGEIAYAKVLGAEAKAWIKDNPASFARLCVKHLGQYYFPPRWQWNIYLNERQGRGIALRQALAWSLSVFGLIGAFAALLTWRNRIVYMAVFALMPALPYIITQPVPRYRYLVFLPLLFLTVNTLWSLIQRLQPGTRAATKHAPFGDAGAAA